MSSWIKKKIFCKVSPYVHTISLDGSPRISALFPRSKKIFPPYSGGKYLKSTIVSRKRKVIYFNPPWSSDVRTNIGGKFLEIVKSTFHEKHPLFKLCNRNTLKVSYSCLPNQYGKQIKGRGIE